MKIKSILKIIPFLTLISCNNSSPSQDQKETPIDTGSDSMLVAYFSVTNNTKKIAGYVKDYLECDSFEIVPEQEYTLEDINYNSDCRANREQNDPASRPAIKYTIEDISKYDTIVLGYPIWWGQAPKIMYSFIESYNLEGKTILPFCTSGSSPIGSSATNLSKSAPKANWLDGQRFSASSDKQTVNEWLDKYIKKVNNMNLLIDEQAVEVAWENNASVDALKKLAKNTLRIEMTLYGGFEQVGPIGSRITSQDQQMTTTPGDIVLYSSSNVVIFFGSNSWLYTKLGHINLSENELRTILNKESVVVTFKGE